MEPVVFLKAKYSNPKPVSGYKSGSSTAGHAKKSRKKTPNREKPTVQHVMVLADGKIRWIVRPV